MTSDAIATAIRAAAPHADAVTWSAALLSPMQSNGIVTAKRIAMFIGQCAEETGGFTALSENLNYSTDGLMSEFGKHFASAAEAATYAHQPERIANRVYANRNGNGDEASGDGWRFRGRGPIEVTGRELYEACAKALGHVCDDLFLTWLETPEGGAASSCWYWGYRGDGRLLTLSDAWDVRGVTLLVNGGLTNLAARVKACGAALAALAAGPVVVATHAPGSTVVASDPDHSADALMLAEEQQIHGGAA